MTEPLTPGEPFAWLTESHRRDRVDPQVRAAMGRLDMAEVDRIYVDLVRIAVRDPFDAVTAMSCLTQAEVRTLLILLVATEAEKIRAAATLVAEGDESS